jgi:hypothetical protein
MSYAYIIQAEYEFDQVCDTLESARDVLAELAQDGATGCYVYVTEWTDQDVVIDALQGGGRVPVGLRIKSEEKLARA